MKIVNKKIILLILMLLMMTTNQALQASNNTIVTRWNDAALEAIRTVSPGPPIAARALAITHTCIFDAWAAYDKKATGIHSHYHAHYYNSYAKNQAISYAAHECLSDLFPTQKSKFDALMSSLGYDPDNDSAKRNTPAGIGNLAGRAVLKYRHNDGSNQLGDLTPGHYSDYTGYTPVNTPTQLNDPSRWQPLTVNGVTQKFMVPHWSKVKPFALTTGSQFRYTLVKPANYDADPDDYEYQAQQLVEFAANLDDQKKAIAEYWSDGPKSELPPGHWTLFADYISRRDHHNVEQDVKMFFTLTNALFDASIACWDAKRHFDSIRPISVIRFLFEGQTIDSWRGPVDGAEWQPFQQPNFVTPPFAEYVSGHSTFSAAAAEILKRFTKSNYFNYSVVIPANSSKIESGSPKKPITLKWQTFTKAAEQAGLSRCYGGIHFQQGNLEGLKLGRLVGKEVWKKAEGYWH